MESTGKRHTGNVLGAHIDALSWNAALDRLLGWARGRESRYVTICNVHVVVSASQDAPYRDIINGSDMATPDGAPVAWMLRWQGVLGSRSDCSNSGGLLQRAPGLYGAPGQISAHCTQGRAARFCITRRLN